MPIVEVDPISASPLDTRYSVLANNDLLRCSYGVDQRIIRKSCYTLFIDILSFSILLETSRFHPTMQPHKPLAPSFSFVRRCTIPRPEKHLSCRLLIRRSRS